MKQNSNIPKVTMTTNGYQLNKIAEQLHETGLDGINISIDSLNREMFKKLTGHDRLLEILEGIKILQKLNFKSIKVNAVLLKGINDTYGDFKLFGNFIRENKIDFRFIELMQTGDNLDYFKKNHVSSAVFKDYLEKNDWIYQTHGKDAGPALNFIHPEYKGKFGIIAPYSKDFCKTCNRLRITSRGDLRLCLFGNTGISIRHLLQNDNQKEELVDLIIKQLHLKKESHYLELGDTGITPNLSNIGG
jgi:cyclic pyranopterin phosphate synthase